MVITYYRKGVVKVKEYTINLNGQEGCIKPFFGVDGISDIVSVQRDSCCTINENNKQHHYETSTT